MKDAIISIFFSNGDSLKINAAESDVDYTAKSDIDNKSLNGVALDSISMATIKGGGFVCPQCTNKVVKKRPDSASTTTAEAERSISGGS